MEFSLILVPFLLILMGIADLGRGVYTNNGVAQAAREIARATSVHVCASSCTLGNSAETQDAIAVQKSLVPGLAGAGASIAFTCTTINDTPVSGSGCARGNFVRVTVRVPFTVLTPLMSMVAPTTFTSTAHVEVP